VPLAAIIFDFDGVIANSEPLHFQAFRDEVAVRGIVLTESAYYRDFLGFDDAAAFRAIGHQHRTDWSDAEIAAMVDSKAERIEALEARVSILFPGAADAIRRAAAVVPIGIASGALTAEILRILEREHLGGLFTAVVGADQTRASKPSPDPYQHAMDVMGARLRNSLHAPHCVALEDSHWGLESARAAGLRTIGVAQTYAADALTSADLVIASIAALDVEQAKQLVERRLPADQPAI
jgi:beta-phosphoglucomutase-like phosphatase (HAD superfamily)